MELISLKVLTLIEGTLTWTKFHTSGPAPGPRYHHAMVAVGKTLYVHGGYKDGKGLSDFWCLDFKAFSGIHLKL